MILTPKDNNYIFCSTTEMVPSNKKKKKINTLHMCFNNSLYFHFLFVLQKYQEHLKKTGSDGDDLDAVIELLQHTSEIVSLFNDRLYIHSSDDQRLQKLSKFFNWMCHWASETEGNSKSFISCKFWFDLQSMCLGFQSLVHYKMTRFPSTVIKPAIVNQDCVENHFCQIRSCNGQNDNPTFLQQTNTDCKLITL